MGASVPYKFKGGQVIGSTNFGTQLDADFAALSNGSRTILPDSRYPGGVVGGVTYGAIFYVGTNGADVPSGGTPAAPWLTLAYAMSQLTSVFDFGGQAVLLLAVAGHAAFTGNLHVTAWTGGGSFTFDGGGGSITYAGVIVQDGAILVTGDIPGDFTYQNVTLSTTQGTASNNPGINVFGFGQIHQGPGVVFSTCVSGHIFTIAPCVFNVDADFQVSGSAPILFLNVNASIVSSSGQQRKIKFTNPVTYSVVVEVAGASFNRVAPFIFQNASGTTISLNSAGNNVTGTNFFVQTAGTIDTNGKGPTFIPGTVQGTVQAPGSLI